MISLSGYFEADSEEQRKFKLVTERCPCHVCTNRKPGVCTKCDGAGKVAHECDCDHCTLDDEADCTDCNRSGKCRYCKGSGLRRLNDRELKQSGLTESEIKEYRGASYVEVS